jgi:hypothetical protein
MLDESLHLNFDQNMLRISMLSRRLCCLVKIKHIEKKNRTKCNTTTDYVWKRRANEMHKFRGARYLFFIKFQYRNRNVIRTSKQNALCASRPISINFVGLDNTADPPKKYSVVVEFVNLICTQKALFYYSFLLV